MQANFSDALAKAALPKSPSQDSLFDDEDGDGDGAEGEDEDEDESLIVSDDDPDDNIPLRLLLQQHLGDESDDDGAPGNEDSDDDEQPLDPDPDEDGLDAIEAERSVIRVRNLLVEAEADHRRLQAVRPVFIDGVTHVGSGADWAGFLLLDADITLPEDLDEEEKKLIDRGEVMHKVKNLLDQMKEVFFLARHLGAKASLDEQTIGMASITINNMHKSVVTFKHKSAAKGSRAMACDI